MHNRCFLLCRHVFMSSFRLFSEHILGLYIMKYFSSMHRLHSLLDVEYGLALLTIFHVIENCMFVSFNFHMWSLRAVAERFDLCLKVVVCPEYRLLKVFSVSPMYVSFYVTLIIFLSILLFDIDQSQCDIYYSYANVLSM